MYAPNAATMLTYE
jgi:hypothetical protein